MELNSPRHAWACGRAIPAGPGPYSAGPCAAARKDCSLFPASANEGPQTLHRCQRRTIKFLRTRCAAPSPFRKEKRPFSSGFAAGGRNVDAALPTDYPVPVERSRPARNARHESSFGLAALHSPNGTNLNPRFYRFIRPLCG